MMNKKCSKCGKPATIHLTEIADGQKVEKHLCADCAQNEGIAVKASIPIGQLLEDFVLQAPSGGPGIIEHGDDIPDVSCETCGISFSEIRENGLLGCPNDYRVFSEALQPLIARSQAGQTDHVGKIPVNAGENQQREAEILKMRSLLKDAIRHEHYEKAAHLRDRIKRMQDYED